MNILGIDEAGRGCVIGPMVLGAVVVSEPDWERLVAMGVKDSKLLSPKRRSELLPQIQSIAMSAHAEILAVATIDRYCAKQSLNLLEIETMAALIRKFQPDVVYVDALGKSMSHFLARLQRCLGPFGGKIVAENRADVNYPVVSAASIVAKVTRDGLIAQLHDQLGDFGSGYTSDVKTVTFLNQYYQKFHKFPPAVRQSWSTVKRMVSKQDVWFS